MIVELPGVILVGTAHVSEKSVNEVREAIATHEPQIVAVELDENRFKAITDKKKFEETPITDLLKSGKAPFILAHAMLASFQRRMGEKYGVEPGAEMLAAIREAEARKSEIVLADRDIGITLKRAWARMGFGEKMRLAWEFMKGVVGAEDTDHELDVDEMLEEDVLTVMMQELSDVAPSVSEVLVKERDAYLAKNIHEARQRAVVAARSASEGEDDPNKVRVVAVIGAGHMKGVVEYLERPETLPDTKAFETIPKKRFRWGLWISILISALIVGWLGYAFYTSFTTGDWTGFRDNLLGYVLATGGCTALGAILGGGGVWAALAGFIAAPTKPLHFFVGSGVFPGLVQAKINKPTVKDFQGISRIEKVTDLWRNKVTNILMVASMAQLGANVGLYFVFPVFVLGKYWPF